MLLPKFEEKRVTRRTTYHVKGKKRQIFSAQLEKQEDQENGQINWSRIRDPELAFVTQSFMNELTGVLVPITLRTDNKSLWQNIHSTKQLSDERLQIDISIMREMVEKKEVAKVEWVSTEKQLADCLTKKGASSRKLVQALRGGWAL